MHSHFKMEKKFSRHGVVIEVANHGQIQHPLAGLDVGNVCYPLLIGLLCESSPRCCPLSTFYGSMHLHSDPQQETSGAEVMEGKARLLPLFRNKSAPKAPDGGVSRVGNQFLRMTPGPLRGKTLPLRLESVNVNRVNSVPKRMMIEMKKVIAVVGLGLIGGSAAPPP